MTMSSPRFLEGRTALVTGSTSGIGLGIARTLAQAGAGIVLNGLGDAAEIERIRQDIADTHRVTVRYDDANLADRSAIEGLAQRAMQHSGGIDILINNAGIQHVAPIDQFPVDKWDLIMALMLTAPFDLTRTLLPYMRQKNWGRIIHIASAHGKVASANKSAYVAAKHGLVGLSKVIALETAGTNITSNAICPGWVLTPLVQKQIDAIATRDGIDGDAARRQLLMEKQPSGEFATPEQIGALCLFLCGDAAAQIRGTEISIDGGWTAQ